MQIREDAADHYLQEHPDPTCPDRHATQRPPNQYSFAADRESLLPTSECVLPPR